jgi:hypothetical protein
MAPASSKAPALATESDARNTNQRFVKLGVIGPFEIASRLENAEGARRELVTSVHTNCVERIGRRIEARKIDAAARGERVVKNQIG